MATLFIAYQAYQYAHRYAHRPGALTWHDRQLQAIHLAEAAVDQYHRSPWIQGHVNNIMSQGPQDMVGGVRLGGVGQAINAVHYGAATLTHSAGGAHMTPPRSEAHLSNLSAAHT